MESFRSIQLVPKDASMVYANGDELRNSPETKRVIKYTIEYPYGDVIGCYMVIIRSNIPSDICVDTVRGLNPESIYWSIRGWMRFKKPRGSSEPEFIDATIMKFKDKSCEQQVSFKYEDMLPHMYTHWPKIRAWAKSYEDDLKPK